MVHVILSDVPKIGEQFVLHSERNASSHELEVEILLSEMDRFKKALKWRNLVNDFASLFHFFVDYFKTKFVVSPGEERAPLKISLAESALLDFSSEGSENMEPVAEKSKVSLYEFLQAQL